MHLLYMYAVLGKVGQDDKYLPIGAARAFQGVVF